MEACSSSHAPRPQGIMRKLGAGKASPMPNATNDQEVLGYVLKTVYPNVCQVAKRSGLDSHQDIIERNTETRNGDSAQFRTRHLIPKGNYTLSNAMHNFVLLNAEPD